jgi:hypothetical protein
MKSEKIIAGTIGILFMVSIPIGFSRMEGPVADVQIAPTSTVAPSTSTTIPVTSRWDTRDTDPTASWPSMTDPTRFLTPYEQDVFACIRFHESRNHAFSVNGSSGATGWYQFMPYIWDFARRSLGDLPALASEASTDQQSEVAVFYYKRNHSWSVQWGGNSQCLGGKK